MADDDYYGILGLSKTSTKVEIKKAYKKLALKYHPDRNKGCKQSESKFKKVSEAYEILSDDQKRKIYDTHGKNGLKGHHFQNSDNIFNMFFSGMNGFSNMFRQEPRKPQKMPNVLYPMNVNLEDVYNGIIKKLRVQRQRVCVACDGSGYKINANKIQCHICKSQGYITHTQRIPGFGNVMQRRNCYNCNGQKYVNDPNDTCKECNNKKVYNSEKIIEIDIKPGTQDGEILRFVGEADEAPSVKAGDLHIQIKINNSSASTSNSDRWERDQEHLYYHKTISLHEALFGYDFEIKHINSKTYRFQRKGVVISPGTKHVVRNLGMPIKNSDNSYGDLYLVFDISFPKFKDFEGKEKDIRKIFPGKPNTSEFTSKSPYIPRVC